SRSNVARNASTGLSALHVIGDFTSRETATDSALTRSNLTTIGHRIGADLIAGGQRAGGQHAVVACASSKVSAWSAPKEYGGQRLWESWVLRAGNQPRRADDMDMAGPLAHGRVAGGGARPRRCGRGDRGQ